MNPHDRTQITEPDERDSKWKSEQIVYGTPTKPNAEWQRVLEEVYREHQGEFLRFVRNQLRMRGCYDPPDHAWDVFHDCMTEVCKHPPLQFDIPKAIISYLYTALKWRVYDHLRLRCSVLSGIGAVSSDLSEVEKVAAPEDFCISEYRDLLVKFRAMLDARDSLIWDYYLAKKLDGIEVRDEYMAERLEMTVELLRVNRFRLLARFAKFVGLEKKRKERKKEQKE